MQDETIANDHKDSWQSAKREAQEAHNVNNYFYCFFYMKYILTSK